MVYVVVVAICTFEGDIVDEKAFSLVQKNGVHGLVLQGAIGSVSPAQKGNNIWRIVWHRPKIPTLLDLGLWIPSLLGRNAGKSQRFLKESLGLWMERACPLLCSIPNRESQPIESLWFILRCRGDPR
jgi:hypothetical protein